MSNFDFTSTLIDAMGVPLGTPIQLVYGHSIEKGAVTPDNFLLARLNENDNLYNAPVPIHEFNTNSFSEVLSSTAKIERLDPNTGEVADIIDDGTDPNSGQLYHSRVTITPDQPLLPNTSYAVIVGDAVALQSVYDMYTTAPGLVDIKGPSILPTNGQYAIEITQTGTVYDAKYTVSELIGGTVSEVLTAKNRYIEVGDGLQVKFLTGTFTAGEIFNFNTVPPTFSGEITGFRFSTTDDITKPDGESSSTVINLPTRGLNLVDQEATGAPKVISITPGDASTFVDPGTLTMVIKFDRDIQVVDDTRIKMFFESIDPLNSAMGQKTIDSVSANNDTLTITWS